jgi:hypothetical protein
MTVEVSQINTIVYIKIDGGRPTLPLQDKVARELAIALNAHFARAGRKDIKPKGAA